MESLNEFMKLSLPTKTSWNISKNMKKLEGWYKTFSDCEMKLVNELAVKGEDGKIKYDDENQPKFAPKNREEFIKRRNELLNCEDEIDFLKINLSDLEKVNVKASTLFNLDFMITDDTEEKETVK